MRKLGRLGALLISAVSVSTACTTTDGQRPYLRLRIPILGEKIAEFKSSLHEFAARESFDVFESETSPSTKDGDLFYVKLSRLSDDSIEIVSSNAVNVAEIRVFVYGEQNTSGLRDIADRLKLELVRKWPGTVAY